MAVWVILLSFVILQVIPVHSVRVCKTFTSYYSGRDCYSTINDELEVPDLIRRYGYKVETHFVETYDGYNLTVFRIPAAKAHPVLLQHGMLTSSMAWVVSPRKSLAFQLADAGYDVWLGNFRGTRYSLAHKYLIPEGDSFWDYSFHEMGLFDAPAVLTYIGWKTKQTGNIVYIGHDMGATAGIIYNIMYPDHASLHLKAMICIAPLVYTTKSERRLLSMVFGLLVSVESWFVGNSNGAFFKRTPENLAVIRNFCHGHPVQTLLCRWPIYQLSGFNLGQLDLEDLPVTIIQNYEAISHKTIRHFNDMLRTGEFKYYDYGTNESNKEHYGHENWIPPYYLSKINVPVQIVYGQNDKLVRTQDATQLYESLPDNVKNGIWTPDSRMFTHWDFLEGKDVAKLVNNRIVTFIADTFSENDNSTR